MPKRGHQGVPMNSVVSRKSLKPKPELPPVDPNTLDAASLARREAYRREQEERQARPAAARPRAPQGVSMDDAFRQVRDRQAGRVGEAAPWVLPARQKGVMPSKQKPTRRENGL